MGQPLNGQPALLSGQGSSLSGAPLTERSEPEKSPGWTRGDTVRTVLSLAIAVLLLGAAAWIYTIRGDEAFGPVPSFSLLAGAALGILFERGRFCFYCIFRDFFEKKDSRGIYSILTAIAVGSIGYTFIYTIRLFDPSGDRLPNAAHIAPVSLILIVAGLVFGLGIVISGGCIAGHLYRLGEGNLRAIPGFFGTMIGFGIGFLTWNPLYEMFIRSAPVIWFPQNLGYGLALGFQLLLIGVIAVALLRWNPPVPARPVQVFTLSGLRRQVFFKRWPALLTGALVGLVGVVAYLRDRPLGVTSQLSSISRTVLDGEGWLPETLRGLDETLGGCVALVVETITNNGWLIIGIVLGSLAAALPGRRFKIEKLTLRNSSTALIGGIMLGWGAIIGLGCTIGVFLSGTQALSLSGWVFAAAVTAGLGIGFSLRLHRS